MASRGTVKRLQTPKTKRIVWEARIAATDRNGSRHHLRRRFSTKRAAEAWLSQTEAAVLVDGISVSPAMTVAAYAEVWLARMATTWAPGTVRRAGHSWAQLAPVLGDVRLDRLDRARCQATVDALVRAGYAPRTVRSAITLLRSLLHGAVRDELIARDPSSNLLLPRVERREVPRWTPEQTRAFLAYVEGTDLHALGAVLLLTGLRIGEALGLRWRAIDLERATLRVAAAVVTGPEGTPTVSSEVKSASSRRLVPLAPALVDALRQHRDRQAAWLKQTGYRNADDLLFLGSDGRLLHPATARLHLYTAMKAAGVPKLSPHDLRHQVATQLMEAGVNPIVVSRLLGHHGVTITLDTYTSVSSDMTRSATDVLAGMLDDE